MSWAEHFKHVQCSAQVCFTFHLDTTTHTSHDQRYTHETSNCTDVLTWWLCQIKFYRRGIAWLLAKDLLRQFPLLRAGVERHTRHCRVSETVSGLWPSLHRAHNYTTWRQCSSCRRQLTRLHVWFLVIPLSGNNSGQVIQTDMTDVSKQDNLVPATMLWGGQSGTGNDAMTMRN